MIFFINLYGYVGTVPSMKKSSRLCFELKHAHALYFGECNDLVFTAYGFSYAQIVIL